MAELKPCPFCGGEADMTKRKTAIATFYRVFCANYDCKVKPSAPERWIKDDAIEAWNRRYEPKEELEFDYGAEVE